LGEFLNFKKDGEDLLRKLLNPDPVKRISLKEAMEHAWLNEGYANPLKPFPYPNKPTEDQVNPTILRYMNSNMEFNGTEVAENIKTNKPSSSLATYYLLLNKVKTKKIVQLFCCIFYSNSLFVFR
jgi:Neu-associated kinase